MRSVAKSRLVNGLFCADTLTRSVRSSANSRGQSTARAAS
jgi:hypothetical protein